METTTTEMLSLVDVYFWAYLEKDTAGRGPVVASYPTEKR